MATRAVVDRETTIGTLESHVKRAPARGHGRCSTGGMRNRLAPVGQPLFLAALVLLVLNDHVFKGSGALPSVVTGKVSDLAGMIVAPVLLASLVGPFHAARRWAAFAVVTALFCAVKLSADAAHGAELALATIGVPWRLWADPTDLVMLVPALPLAELVVRRAARGDALFAGERFVQKGLAVTAALACVATSVPEPLPLAFNATAYVVNRTDSAFDLRVRWLRAEVRCDEIRDEFELALGREAFGSSVAFQIAPNHAIPLDRAAIGAGFVADVAITDALAEPMTPNGCDAVLLEAEGMRSTIVFLEGGVFEQVFEDLSPGVATPVSAGELAITASDVGFDLVPARIEPRPFVSELGPVSCGSPVPFAWSEIDRSLEGFVVKEADHTADGCTRLLVEEPAEATAEGADPAQETLYLCIPPQAAPFAIGDRVDAEAIVSLGGVEGLHLLRYDGGRVTDEMYLFRGGFGVSSVVAVDAFELLVVPNDCDGERDRCGAFGARGAVLVSGRDGLVVPGDHVRFDEGGGLSRTLYVGDARRGSVTVPNVCARELSLGTNLLGVVHVEYAEAM
jgi:hypothetical protein